MTAAEPVASSDPTLSNSPISGVPYGDLDPDLKRVLAPRVERLGYLGGFFQVSAHQPAMLRAFIEFTEAAKSALPADVIEVIALSAATITGNGYERFQHEQLALRSGMSMSWVGDVIGFNAEGLSDEQAAVQSYVRASLDRHGHGAKQELQRVVTLLGQDGAVAVMLTCARYCAHALVVNSCEITPPVASIFDDPEHKSG
jgi:alkylhydroperoxidase family enzyme